MLFQFYTYLTNYYALSLIWKYLQISVFFKHSFIVMVWLSPAQHRVKEQETTN